MNILEKIVTAKRLEIENAKRERPLDTAAIRALKREHRPFRALFEKGPVVIAEIKPKSPSAGVLIQDTPLDVARLYAQSDAGAISVLTDEKHFGGSLDLLQSVRALVPQPVFRKEFIIDPYQIYETQAAGADAFLLIASILSPQELASYIALGTSLGLDMLVEVHDETDLDKALAAHAPLIGINNRDLATMRIDLATTERLMPRVPDGLPVVSESGIETADDVRRVRAADVRGILVGTSILRAPDPTATIAELTHALYA